MAEAFDLGKMLEEIMDDEKISVSKNRKVSQDEIKKMLLDRQKNLARQGRRQTRLQLGEALEREGVISTEQLHSALKLQSQKGGKIGSILVEMGVLTEDDLLSFLGKQHGLQSTSLLDLEISEDLMSLLPSRVIFKHRILPLRMEGRTLDLGIENPNELTAIHEVEFLTGKRVRPVIIPSYQMELAIKYIEEKGGGIFSGHDIQSSLKGTMTIRTLLEQLVSADATDLLVTAGVPPTVRANTTLRRTSLPSLSPDQCVAYAKALMTERQWEDFLNRRELDFAIEYDNLGRFRVNTYRQKNTVSIAIRRVMQGSLGCEALGIPTWLEEFAMKPQGLVIVTAPTGHGKTTTLAAMVDVINRTRRCNIITLEDPIEYLHKPVKSNINQREVGTDTASFSEGLRRIFRQNPDVIMIGEVRDQETFEIAARAASTGHLVLTSTHAPNATAAIENMVNCLPHHLQMEVRLQLSDALLVVFAQRLIPSKDGTRVYLAYEKLINSYRIKNFIRDNRVHQIRTQIQQEADDFASIDFCLAKLLNEGKITIEDVSAYADSVDFVVQTAAKLN
jgi:twitching motility protein PilT